MIGVIAFCFVLNSVVGYSGLFCSGGPAPNVITDSLSFSKPLDAAVNALLALQIAWCVAFWRLCARQAFAATHAAVSTFPQVSFVVLQVLEEYTPDKIKKAPKLQYVPRVAVLLLICGLGGALSNVSAILALFGGASNACVTFVLPIVFNMSMFRNWQWRSWRTALNLSILAASTAAAILATLFAAIDLFENSGE